jgi:hypothetical protein
MRRLNKEEQVLAVVNTEWLLKYAVQRRKVKTMMRTELRIGADLNHIVDTTVARVLRREAARRIAALGIDISVAV